MEAHTKESTEDHLRKAWTQLHETTKELKEFQAQAQAKAEQLQKETRRLATSLQKSNDQIKELTKKLEDKNGSLKEDEREKAFIKINEEIRMLKAQNSSFMQAGFRARMEKIEARLIHLERQQCGGIPVDVRKSQISFCSLYRSSKLMSLYFLSLFKITLENECYCLAFNKSLIFFLAI